MSDMEIARLTYTVKETGSILGLSRGLTYEAIRNGQIPSVRIGRRILVPCKQLQKLLESSNVAEGKSGH